MSGYDDDEWVDGVPPEGHHTRDQAKPAFWWRTRPAQLGFVGILVALLVLVLVVVLAGCGGSSAAADRPRAEQPPADVVRAAADALEGVRSYHVTGTSVDADGRNRISGDITAAGALRFTVAGKAGRFTVIAVDGKTFLKAGRAFWLKGHGGRGDALARVLAGRWVQMPASTSASLRKDVRQLLPKELAYCVGKGLGTLENLGGRTANGRKVVVIRDKGDKAGTSPGELTVPATGPALPLRVRQTGRRSRRGGGQADPRCQDDDDTTTESESVLSRFNAIKPIQAPAGALDLNTLGGPGGGGTPA